MAASSSSTAAPAPAPEGPTAEDICRICFLTSDECSDEGTTSPDQYKLISPCKCVGSQKYVHLGCLRKWQRTIQLNGPNHPEDRMNENRHMVCNVCKTPFNLEPQDRASMMAEFAGVVPEEISPGLLLVTKKAGSQATQGANLDLGLRAFLESKAAHFREAVYILTDVFPNRSGTGDGSDVVLGVNLSRRLEVSPDVSCLKGAVSIVTLRRFAQQGISVLWMNGGPVEPRSVTAMCVAEQLSIAKKEELLSRIPNITELTVGSSTDSPASSTIQASAVFCGSLEGILSMAAETSRGRKGACNGIVLAWAGFAQWSRAQLLGEMARGSWGWCRGSFTDVTVATAVAAGLDDEPRDALRESLPQRSHFIWGRSHPNESSSSSSPNSSYGRNRSSSPSPARRAHYKEPLWNTLRPSDRLSWAPDNEVARSFESRIAQSWHGPTVTTNAQQVHNARLIVQQFEAKIWDFIPFRGTGDIKLLVIALNYEYVPGAELTCHKDADVICKIAGRAHVVDITLNTDRRGVGSINFPTRKVVLQHIANVAGRCQPGDWFVWFWAGHGVNVPDKNGDEDDGFDQAFVTPDARGKLTDKSVLLDDDFARALETYVPEGVRILCICDCCHSGSICDIDSYRYTHDIYQISASQDNEEAEDIGGGVLTTALKKAVRELSLKNGSQEFSIQDVFDASKRHAHKMTTEQELSFQWLGPDPSAIAWPLSYGWTEYAKDLARPKIDIFDREQADALLQSRVDSQDT